MSLRGGSVVDRSMPSLEYHGRLPLRRRGTHSAMFERTDRFRTALQGLEGLRDPITMKPLFTAGAEVARPELDHAHSPTGDVRQFGKAYLDRFSKIKTEFDTAAFLEP